MLAATEEKLLNMKTVSVDFVKILEFMTLVAHFVHVAFASVFGAN